jgi:hypothetical protein
MAKKIDVKSYLYAIGMALVVIGCFLPLVSTRLGSSSSAFSIITKGSGSGVVRVGAILAMLGAVAGVALTFVKGKMYKLVALVVSILGGLYVFVNYLNQSGAAKGIMKGAAKIAGATPGIGVLLIVVGWIVALLGFFFSRER